MTVEMKDSEIQWLGYIPKEWKLIRLKSAFKNRCAGSWGEEKSNNNGDMICLRIADFDYNKLTFIDSNHYTFRNYDRKTIQKLLLKKGDLLIEKSGGGEKTPVGRAVIFDKDFPALYANFMDRLRCSEIALPKWILYILNVFYANGFVWNYIKQTTGIQNLDLTSMLSRERIPLPKKKQQERISNYLDSKCSKIDSIIDKQQAVIEKLKQYKTSLITEVVTKGLNPNVEMKNSGIDFCKKIPIHWNSYGEFMKS